MLRMSEDFSFSRFETGQTKEPDEAALMVDYPFMLEFEIS
jgi:hypothetical protein